MYVFVKSLHFLFFLIIKAIEVYYKELRKDKEKKLLTIHNLPPPDTAIHHI